MYHQPTHPSTVRSKPNRLRLPARVLIGVLAVLIAISVWLTQPWDFNTDRPASPIGAVAQAYERLHSLETVHYRIDGENSYGQRFVHLNQVDIPNQVVYQGLWADGSDPTADPPNQELLITAAKQFSRSGGGAYEEEWRLMSEVGGWSPFGNLRGLLWKGDEALGETFDRVERLPAGELEGEPVERYLASRTVTGDDFTTTEDSVELWVGPQDRLLRKVDWLHEEQWSQSDEPVDLDRNWCEDPTGHLPEEFTKMSVGYGEPGSNEMMADPPPGHSLQPIRITCLNEDRTRGQTVWRLSIVSPGEEGSDLTVR